ncbi:clavesin-1 [Rhipicephalus sanguineus]|uniref:clavesin-1 n=1 Tax=Rhipicephalus sanguineus TaxID=34632 RepID=UPI0020C4906A|nr:clavesin-1 [Rhipicephalus sanguineus]
MFNGRVIRCLLVATECNLLSEETQIRGAVAIIDMEGFSMHHLLVLSPWFLRRALTIIEVRAASEPVEFRFSPSPHQGILLCKHTNHLSIAYTLIKSLMSPKLRKRVRLLGSDFSALHDILPSDIIPKECGGEREDFDYHRQEKFFLSNARHFEQMSQFGYSST